MIHSPFAELLNWYLTPECVVPVLPAFGEWIIGLSSESEVAAPCSARRPPHCGSTLRRQPQAEGCNDEPRSPRPFLALLLDDELPLDGAGG